LLRAQGWCGGCAQSQSMLPRTPPIWATRIGASA